MWCGPVASVPCAARRPDIARQTLYADAAAKKADLDFGQSGIFACSDARIMSQDNAVSKPPPMAQTVHGSDNGFFKVKPRSRPAKPLAGIVALTRRLRWPFRSSPAENALSPAPWRRRPPDFLIRLAQRVPAGGHFIVHVHMHGNWVSLGPVHWSHKDVTPSFR